MNGIVVAKWRELYTKYNPMNANKPASTANIAFDTGVIAERERIIKLLEEMQVAAETNQSVLWVLENAKVLIKRGNK